MWTDTERKKCEVDIMLVNMCNLNDINMFVRARYDDAYISCCKQLLGLLTPQFIPSNTGFTPIGKSRLIETDKNTGYTSVKLH